VTSAATPLANVASNAHITVTGRVGDIRPQEFDLLYGDEKIKVSLDRFAWTGQENKYLVPGETATVSGYVNDDLFTGRKIEAYNIQLNNSYVYYTTDANAAPPAYYGPAVTAATTATAAPASINDGAYVTMRGIVSNINGREFTLSNGTGKMRIDTSTLDYDPFDDIGLQKVQNGDEVYVYGRIDNDFFQQREIVASNLVQVRNYSHLP
jgi:uncharacterized protein YdeI (BOF family)